MQAVLSRTQINELDRQLIKLAHVPGLVLMENAGKGAALALLRRWPKQSRSTLVSVRHWK